MPVSAEQRRRWRRYWDRNSRGYDRQMGLLDRVLFGETRRWVCSQATGRVLAWPGQPPPQPPGSDGGLPRRWWDGDH